jgi:hypothetical protein
MRIGDGIEIASGGEVMVGPEFRVMETAWIEGVAVMARAGARIIVDEVFLGGAASQQRTFRSSTPLGVSAGQSLGLAACRDIWGQSARVRP